MILEFKHCLPPIICNKFVHQYKNYCIMNIDDLLQGCGTADSATRKANMIRMKQNMLMKMQQLQDKQKDINKLAEIKMLETYIKLLEKISSEVDQMKQKYLTADREDLKDKKMIQLAEQIKFFRSECHLYRQFIKTTKMKTKVVKSRNWGLAAQNQAIRTTLQNTRKKIHSMSLTPKISISRRYQNEGKLDKSEILGMRGSQKQTRIEKIYSGINRRSLQIDPQREVGVFESKKMQKEALNSLSKKFYATLTQKKHPKRSLNFFKQS